MHTVCMATKRWTIHQRPPRKIKWREGDASSVSADGKESQLYDQRTAEHGGNSGPFPEHPHSPTIYHCVNRVVDKRFIFGSREKDRFVELMRMYERFSGNRILAFCVMSNHFHLMIEITPMPKNGLSDEELLNRLAAIYDEATVEAVEMELKEARDAIAAGRNAEGRIAQIHGRYTYRMHDLSEFMKSVVQRFTQWYNRRSERKGNLWEDAFRSTVVEAGVAARIVATYIDLNPVRAGIVDDPANYPWCSYGEAVSGSGSRKKPTPANLRARSGLVRAFFAHEGIEADSKRWVDCHNIERHWIEQAIQKLHAHRRGRSLTPSEQDSPGGALSGRIRHFTEGVAIGEREFLETFFKENRERFGKKRTSGPRAIRGTAAGIAQKEGICAIRDLQKDVEP
jgi:putative transposase